MAETGAGGHSIVVRSIGHASPAVCQQIGSVLGLPAAVIVKRIYQAPAVLMNGLNHQHGCEIRQILNDAGLEVDLEPEPVDIGSPPALFDVAVQVQDIEEFDEVAACLAEFLGCQTEEAERLLETPPGIVLGDVSEATVQALTRRLDGLGASVVAADKRQSVYDLFLLDADPAVRSAMLRDLRASGEACDDSAHAILRSLSYDAAAAIWRRYQSSGPVRVINQAFEQWDIILAACDGSAASLDVLAETAGIPREVCPTLLGHLPLVVEESVSNIALQEKLQAYASGQLDVRAMLTTLRAVRLTIVSGPAKNPLLEQLEESSIDNLNHGLHSYPFIWPVALHDLQARRLKQRFEASGCEVELQEF